MTSVAAMPSLITRRVRIFSAAKLFKEISLSGSEKSLSWHQLAATPDWAFILDEERELFCLTTGCLYYSAAIKRCIQGERIKYISKLVGPSVFGDIVKSMDLMEGAENIDLAKSGVHDDSLKSSFIRAGVGLVVQCTEDKLKPYISQLFVGDGAMDLPVFESGETATIVVKNSWDIWKRNAPLAGNSRTSELAVNS